MNCKSVTTLDLVAHGAGDLSPDAQSEIEAHLASCEHCRQRLEELGSRKEQFLAEHPFGDLDLSGLNGRPSRSATIVRFPRKVWYGLAACCVLAFTGIYLPGRVGESGEPGYRIKGGEGIAIWVMGADGTPEVRDPSVFFSGERVQLTYSCSEPSHMVLVSVDGSGGVSCYFPPGGDSSGVVTAGQDIPLPHSIILDDYVGIEVYVGLFSTTPLSIDEVCRFVSEHAEQLGGGNLERLEVPRGAYVSTVVTTKGIRR